MYAAADKNINKFHKGYVNGPGYEDPTYLGFKLVFDFTPVGRNQETGETDNSLFATNNGLESAYNYFNNIGMPNRATAIQRFSALLQDINSNSPWFFQSVEGLADIWKIELGENFNNYRGKGKTITINCLESLDMRITALADLYRKAMLDTKYMREVLPENLRWFTLNLQIAEMRSFRRLVQAANNQRPIYSDNAALGNTLSGQDTEFLDSAQSSDGTRWQDVSNLISVLEFRFSHCEFDFTESFPTDGSVVMNGEVVMAKQRIKINVRKILERNIYQPLNIVISDQRLSSDGDLTATIGQNTNLDGTSTQGQSDIDTSFTPRSNFNPISNAINSLASDAASLANQVGGLGTQLVAKGVNAVEQAVTAAALGNVYTSIQNQSLTEIISGFSGSNPADLGLNGNVYGVRNLTTATVSSIGNANTQPVPVQPTSNLGNAETPPPPSTPPKGSLGNDLTQPASSPSNGGGLGNDLTPPATPSVTTDLGTNGAKNTPITFPAIIGNAVATTPAATPPQNLGNAVKTPAPSAPTQNLGNAVTVTAAPPPPVQNLGNAETPPAAQPATTDLGNAETPPAAQPATTDLGNAETPPPKTPPTTNLGNAYKAQ